MNTATLIAGVALVATGITLVVVDGDDEGAAARLRFNLSGDQLGASVTGTF